MGRTGTISDQQVLVALIRRIDTAEATRRMVGRFRAEIPAYRHLPELLVETAVTEMVRQNLEVFVQSVVRGRAPGERELAPFGRSAEERAAEGFPLEDLVHAYRLGGRMLWQELADAAAPDERDALPLAADLVMAYIDAVSTVVTRSYLGRSATHAAESERHLRDLLAALMSGEPPLPVDHELADRLGFPILDSYRPFAAVMPRAPRRAHARLAARLRVAGVFALTEGNRVVGLLSPDGREPDAGEDVLLVAGPPVRRAELGEGLEEIRLLADISQRYGHARRLAVDEFLPELLLARSPRLAATLRERILGPLEGHGQRRGADLVGTLDALVECDLDRRRAAAALHVHRNTLDYRVRRAEELAEIDLSRPRDLTLVCLALRQRELEAAGPAREAGR